ncbi:MAG TPA: hypothetical protein V6D07_06720 [Trichocoleus sp.]
MVSLVWMLTMLQEFSAIESFASREAPAAVAKAPSLVEPAPAEYLKAAKNSAKVGPDALLTL